MTKWYSVGIMLAVALLAACGTSPKLSLHTLSDPVRQPLSQRQGLSVAVMPVNLPELFNRPQMVVREADDRILVLEQQRWAEPLRQEISRRLAADLSALIDSARVVALPDDVQALNPDYRLIVDVQRIDAVQTEGVAVDVVWRFIARDGKVLQGRTTRRATVSAAEVPAMSAQVVAYRQVFRLVAEDMAASLKR